MVLDNPVLQRKPPKNIALLVAAKAACTLDSAEGAKVTMTCGMADPKAGDKVTMNAKQALEGW